MWRRRAAFGVLSVWGLVSLARLSRIVAPGETPPGGDLGPLLDFLKARIPQDTGYLFVSPAEFGADTGVGQRLRYELYPRPYDKARASQDEASIRQLMHSEGLRFIVVADARRYDLTYWLRQPREWLKRIDFDSDRYLLEVVA